MTSQTRGPLERLLEERLVNLPYTDYGLAERLTLSHGEDLRYVPGVGWFWWDGQRWRRDDDGAVMRCAKATVRSLREVAARLEDTKASDALWKFAQRSEHRARLEAAIVLAASEPLVLARIEDLDRAPFFLNVANGTLDLRAGGFRPHAREDLITKMVNVNYVVGAECPTWSAFLARVFDADHELQTFVQKVAGYCLTGDTSEQVMLILYGGGANGKSVLTETLLTLAGGYGAAVDPQTFTANQGGGILNDLARLRGARVVKTVETEQGTRLARQLIKRVTGQDKIAARFLYKEWFEYTPQFKLLVVTNHLPEIPGEDRATWRRIRLVPFDVTIPHGEQDRGLLVKLQQELPGILNWAVEGALLQQREGLGVPPSVGDATRSYKNASDPIGRFIDEQCNRKQDATTEFGLLHATYRRWTNAEGIEHPADARAFGKSLTERGYHPAKGTNGVRVRRGLELR